MTHNSEASRYIVSGTRRRAEDFIPTDALELIPFGPVPYRSWGDSPDVLVFLRTLYAEATEVLGPDGTREQIWTDFGKDIFTRTIPEIEDVIRAFSRQDDRERERVHHRRRWLQTYDPQALSRWPEQYTGLVAHEDATLGLALKAYIAWKGIVQHVLEESMFFSIAHILETERELEASVLLAQDGYYKQAHQLLRSFLEEVVVPLHFILEPQAFEEWKAGTYKIGSLRGRSGLLRRLKKEQVLDAQLADEIGALYRSISASVHGAEDRLSLAGVYSGREDQDFPISRLHDWAATLANAVFLGVRLTRRAIIEWVTRKPQQLQCSVCHLVGDFDEKEFVFGGELFVQYRCRACGSMKTRGHDSQPPAPPPGRG
jgi:hypothetical protein